MSEDRSNEPVPEDVKAPEEDKDRKAAVATAPTQERVVIWAWPKTIVFWPTCLCALIFGFISLGGKEMKPLRDIANVIAPFVSKVTVIELGAQPEGAGAAKPAAEAAAPSAAGMKAAIQKVDGIATRTMANRGRSMPKWLGVIFLCVFAFNLIAFSFDIEVKGLAIGVLAVAVIIFGSVVFAASFDFLGFLHRFLLVITPVASAAFYFIIGCLMVVILLIAMVSTYLHRVDVTHNEVRVRTGLLEAEKRISTQRLTFTKDITDLMEHWFLFFGFLGNRFGCGRLVFNHPQLDGPVVLDNVIGVEGKAETLGKILGVMAVKDGD